MPFPVIEKKEEFDALPESIRAEYEEKDGKWTPRDETVTLRGSLAEERKRREAAEKLVTKTAAELKKLETDSKGREAGLTDEKLNEIRAQVRKDLEEEYKPIIEKEKNASTENRTLKLDNQVRNVMGSEKVKVRPERQEALWKLIGDRFDLTDDGKPMVKAKPGVTVEKYLAEDVKAEFGEFYVGTGASGGGAPPGSRNGAGSGAPTAEAVLANPSAALQQARAAGKTE